jgi:hypothetical protein
VKPAKLRAWVESPEFQRALLIGLCSPFFTDRPEHDPLGHAPMHKAKARRITHLLVETIEGRSP